jgi:hypothetical protein
LPWRQVLYRGDECQLDVLAAHHRGGRVGEGIRVGDVEQGIRVRL